MQTILIRWTYLHNFQIRADIIVIVARRIAVQAVAAQHRFVCFFKCINNNLGIERKNIVLKN